jgi:hypothetical protein
MLDWLQGPWLATESPTISTLTIRLLAAAFFGWIISVVYRWKRADSYVPPTFPVTLILLSVMIAMVTQVVGDHVARAFSLVGALSIVRFRTVVEDTLDIAFVIFAVVVGMSLGSGDFVVASLGSCIAIAVLAIGVLRPRHRDLATPPRASSLIVRTALGSVGTPAFQPVLEDCFSVFQLIAAETVRGGSACEWSYRVQLRRERDPKSILDQLTRIDGVQAVTWKDDSR